MADEPRKRTFRRYSYRGVDLEQLLDMSTDELVELFPARQRRRCAIMRPARAPRRCGARASPHVRRGSLGWGASGRHVAPVWEDVLRQCQGRAAERARRARPGAVAIWKTKWEGETRATRATGRATPSGGSPRGPLWRAPS
jgi:hypothetical protein